MLTENQASQLFETAGLKGADFVELFFEDKEEIALTCLNAHIQNSLDCNTYGVGVRVMKGENSGFASTSDTSFAGVSAALNDAIECMGAGNGTRLEASFTKLDFTAAMSVKPFDELFDACKAVSLLKDVCGYGMGVSEYVKKIEAQYHETRQKVCVVNSDGAWNTEKRFRSRIRYAVVVSENGADNSDWSDIVRNDGIDGYSDRAALKAEAERIVRSVLIPLKAECSLTGVMPVVFEGGESSIFHEACGHPFEGNDISNGNSVFSGLMGQKVASERVTWIDEGCIDGLYGTCGMDDEGNITQRNVLIDKGILTGYMLDRLSARRLGLPVNGCGRRQGYDTVSVSRMSNTYIAAGDDDPDEMIASLKHGLFVKSIGGEHEPGSGRI